jgi:hypothetical protein
METLDRFHARAVAFPALRVFTILTRVLLALAFVPSGLVKIRDVPFTSLPVTDPVGQFFAGFFSAHGYYQFVGVAQWIAAGLLIVPRTATLGGLVYFPIVLNIFAITMAIGPSFAGTRVVTGAMLVANVYLLAWDWDRWKRVLPCSASGAARHGDLVTAVGLMSAAGLGFLGVTAGHLARLRGGALGAPLVLVAVAVVLGCAMLGRAYRRAISGSAPPGSDDAAA